MNDNLSRNLISSEKNVLLMTFGRLRLSQNKFIEANQIATNDKDSCLLVVNAQEWNFERS